MTKNFDPAKKADKLKKTVEILKAKIAKREKAGKDLDKDDVLRSLRHGLRRALRRMIELKPLTLEEKVKKTEKLMEMVNKRADVLKKQGKKAINPFVHSVNKSIKSLTKKLRKFKRIQERAKRAEEKAAKRAAAAAPKAEEAPKTEAPPAQ
jgi:D-aminopeptidase